MKTISNIKGITVTETGSIKLNLEIELSNISELDLSGLLSAKEIETILGGATKETKPAPKPAPKKVSKNNLKKLVGIGAKMESFLNAQGIKTFEQLSNKSFDELRTMLDENELYIIDPTTWADQARELMATA